MRNDSNLPASPAACPQGINAVRDIIDFYASWDVHRTTVLRIAGQQNLTVDEKLTLEWLVCMADRISEHDIKQG